MRVERKPEIGDTMFHVCENTSTTFQSTRPR